ncbi:MAG: shikimate dehydrogenase [Chlorobi bacterium]|nr:shikimate dehydrogenase [Chlorobiota bacterium]
MSHEPARDPMPSRFAPDPDMRERVVLIGRNIAHSRSPRLHNHLFELYGIPLRYELMPLERDEVVAAIVAMKRGGFRGANVTSPHKETVMPALDDLTDQARRIGAVNTIVFDDGRATGHNTDRDGFARSLAGEPLVDAPCSANILGTGGAAMAATDALLGLSTISRLTLYSRSEAHAVEIASGWHDDRLTGMPLDAYRPADLVVHATPVGLAGSGGALLTEEQLRGTGLLYEMIYSPAETELMRRARAVGTRCVGGRRMFVFQAMRAFEIWTGMMPKESDIPADLFA